MEYELTKKDGQWQLTEEGSSQAILAADTKAEAIDRMRDYMHSHGGSVAIHTASGEYQEHRSYTAESGRDYLPSNKTLGIFGVVAVAAVTAACVAWYYRDSIPVERLRLSRF